MKSDEAKVMSVLPCGNAVCVTCYAETTANCTVIGGQAARLRIPSGPTCVNGWEMNCKLEDQNAHLREQNAKCNVQLELLRGRLAHLSTMHPDKDRDTERLWKRRSLSLPKDSSRGSFEGDRPDSDESLADGRNEADYIPSRPATLGRDRRSKSRSPAGLRRASSSDTDANYGEIRFKSRHNGIPRTGLERRYDNEKGMRDSW
ncbi:uncharacterized protein LOC121870050 [Homarus americanus]|uniref:uncharacterized protein LOC121870050 n=1 Tax=Homarus americanus TaxID=6706 RepID=UPI001C489A8A|nr:uncharacterized protein LOC121870050 [Homarus americanus]